MNHIKKYTISLFAALVGLSSCNYLDIEPIGQVIPHGVTQYRALLTEGYRLYPATSRGQLAMLTDELNIVPGNIYSSIENIPVYRWDYNNSLMKEFEWRYYYRTIFQSLAVIDGIDIAEQDGEESKNQIKGEAYALKAYALFELGNLYGKWYDPTTAATDKAVPLSEDIDVEQYYTPATVEQVYASVIKDLNRAIELLEIETQVSGKTMYRFSKQSAKALLARVYLYKREWQMAYDQASELIPQLTLVDLNATPAADQLPWKATSKEMILALDQPYYGANGDIISAGGNLTATALGWFDLTTDLRRTTYVKEQIDPNFGDPLGTLHLSGRSQGDKVSIRTAEIYLIAAEAAANIPALNAQARKLLGSLYEKRMTAEGATAKKAAVEGMTQAELIAEVAMERARELIMEGHRWFDLRRTTRPAITKMLEGQTIRLADNDSRYTLAYPRSAVEANPGLNKQ